MKSEKRRQGKPRGAQQSNYIDNWVKTELRLLFENGATLASPVLVCSRDGTVLWASDGMLALLGYTRLDFERSAIDWDEATPPEYWTLEDRCAGHMQRDERSVFQYVKELIRKDGVRLPVRVQVARSVSESEQTLTLITELTELTGAGTPKDL
jgi:PAS domain S-box-containing protein